MLNHYLSSKTVKFWLKTVTKAPGRAVATEGRCVRAGSK